jgi:hypothetical protein
MGTMLISLAATPAQGQCTAQELAKLIASDTAGGDVFGRSVAVSGNTAVVGAQSAGTGNSAGSAYVFVRTGAPGSEVWTEQAKLTAPDAAAFDNFGVSVALSGDTAVVGADQDDDHPVGATNEGSAYVFVRTGAPGSEVWIQQAKLIASDMGWDDNFGISVAVSGDTAVVGAYGDSPSGSAYVFVRTGTIWSEQAKLKASDAAPSGDTFGNSVAVSGDTVVIGAFQDDHLGGSDAGSAYVFIRSGGVWTEQQKLTASDAAAVDNFGRSVALSGSTVVIGAYGDTHAGGAVAGSAYVFLRTGTLWSEQDKLTASDAIDGDRFGISVAVSGDTAVVGAYFDNHPFGLADAGSAYVFTRSGAPGSEVWTQQAKLIAADAAQDDYFGISAAVSGDTAVVGAALDDHAGGGSAGSAYVFKLTGCGPPCVADLDGGGSVNGLDLALLLGAWTGAAMYAPCPPYQPADFNDDCKVNGLDLALLLGAWGPCS